MPSRVQLFVRVEAALWTFFWWKNSISSSVNTAAMSTGGAQDPCKYALALMDVVFTDEEMLNYHVAGWVTFALATNMPLLQKYIQFLW